MNTETKQIHLLGTLATTVLRELRSAPGRPINIESPLIRELFEAFRNLSTPAKKQKPLTDKEKDSRLRRLNDWSKSNGAKWFTGADGKDSIALSSSLAEGNGVVALSPITKDSTIVQIPRSLFMCYSDALKALEVYADQEIFKNESIALATFLVLESSKLDSKWSPYIDALPREFLTPIHWPIEQVRLLHGSPVQWSTIKMMADILVQWCIIRNLVKEDSRVIEASRFTFDRYLWAISVVESRRNLISTADSSELALVPLWDTINHSDSSDAAISTNYVVDTQMLECKAFKDFARHDQVTMFYGPRSSADFLLHMGFVFSPNSHDTLSVYLPEPAASDEVKAERERVLSVINPAAVSGFFLLRVDGKAPEGLFDLARVSVATAEELKSLETRKSSDPLSDDLERRATDFLLSNFQKLFDSYIALPEGQIYHRQTIEKLHNNEKKVLRANIDALKTRLKRREKSKKKKSKPTAAPTATQ